MDRKEALRAMQTVINATDKTETVLIGTDSFIFLKDKICSFNDEMSFSFPMDTGIDCTIKAADTMRVIEKMKGNNITFSQKGDIIRITDGETSLKMKALEGDDEIRTRLSKIDFKESEWKSLPDDFIEGVKMGFFAAANDVTMPEISGVMIENKYVWASDNIRISRYELDRSVKDKFAIPVSSVKILLRLEEPPIGFTKMGNWLHFRTKSGIIFSCAGLERQFPLQKIKELCRSFGGVLEGDPPLENRIEEVWYEWPSELLNTIDAIAVMANIHEELAVPNITIRRSGNNLIIKGEKHYGSAQTKVPFKGEMFEDGTVVRISPEFLKSIMAITRKFSMPDEAVIKFETEKLWHVMSVLIESKAEDDEDE